jgi:co-chaperonin GroES (HSP10)
MLNACGNRVIVRIPNASETASPGGIVLPANCQQEGVVVPGEVMSVGEGRTDTETVPCKTGELAYFKRSPHETVIDKTDEYLYLVLEFGQVLAVKAED